VLPSLSYFKYVPTEEDELGHDDIYAAWAGGEDGRQVLDNLLPNLQVIARQVAWISLLVFFLYLFTHRLLWRSTVVSICK
jgi:hypothetical protein